MTTRRPKAWAAFVDSFDASIPGTRKNAFDQILIEWHGKPIGFISYGGGAGRGAVNHWRDIVARVQMTGVDTQASFNFREHFPDRIFTPGEHGVEWINALADELSQALEPATVSN